MTQPFYERLRELRRAMLLRKHTPPPMRVFIEENMKGRDFIIGDLHGCHDQLLEKFDKVNFDPAADRLFSVGDLTDRGPESFRCLKLINESWFHSVIGNHEAMLLQFVGARDCTESRPTDFLRNGGGWFEELPDDEKEIVLGLAYGPMLNIPLRLTVKHRVGDFDVVHAQFWDHKFVMDDNIPYDPLYEALMTWGRSLIFDSVRGAAPSTRERINKLHDAGKTELVALEPAYDQDRRLTYVGHTVLKMPMIARSHVFIDTGAYEYKINPTGAGPRSGYLTMIDHATKKIY